MLGDKGAYPDSGRIIGKERGRIDFSEPVTFLMFEALHFETDVGAAEQRRPQSDGGPGTRQRDSDLPRHRCAYRSRREAGHAKGLPRRVSPCWPLLAYRYHRVLRWPGSGRPSLAELGQRGGRASGTVDVPWRCSAEALTCHP